MQIQYTSGRARVKFVLYSTECTGAGVSELTPSGVLTNFENMSGAGVDFLKEKPESFFEYEVSLLI